MRTSGMGMDLPVTTESSDRSSIAIRQGGDQTSDTWATNGDIFLLVEGCFWGVFGRARLRILEPPNGKEGRIMNDGDDNRVHSSAKRPERCG